MNKDKIILDLCGGTQSWVKDYIANGYTVITMTLPDYDVEKWREYPEIVELVQGNKIHGIVAAPPCTMFSIARNDKTAILPRDLRKGMKTVQACLDIVHECLYNPYQVSKNNLKFWALENPNSGYLDRFLGKPSFVFDPSDYGDNHSKKTALWGMFNEPKKTTKGNVIKGDDHNYVKNVEKYFGEKTHLIPEGYKKKTGLSMRTIVRSITPQGFAKAFYKANQ
jgi:hypothetical protein